MHRTPPAASDHDCRRLVHRAALVAALLYAVGAADNTGAQDRASPSGRNTRADRDQSQRLDTTVAVERGTILDLSAGDGRITVLGWDRSDVEVHAVNESGELQFSKSARSVRIEARRGGGKKRDGVVIQVRVPRATRVVVSTMLGSVEVLDVRGQVDADLVSGDVTIRGSAGRTAVTNVSGGVTVSDVDGLLSVSAISGNIALNDVRGNVEVSSNSGDVTMRGMKAGAVQVQVVQGDIEFDGTLAASGRYEFNTHSGDVHLYLPDGARGTLELQSFNGKLESTYPLVLQPNGTELRLNALAPATTRGRNSRGLALGQGQRLEFGGGGGTQVRVSTFNGDVHVGRGPRRPQQEL